MCALLSAGLPKAASWRYWDTGGSLNAQEATARSRAATPRNRGLCLGLFIGRHPIGRGSIYRLWSQCCQIPSLPLTSYEASYRSLNLSVSSSVKWDNDANLRALWNVKSPPGNVPGIQEVLKCVRTIHLLWICHMDHTCLFANTAHILHSTADNSVSSWARLPCSMPMLPCISCVAFGNSLNLSGPQFLYLQNGGNINSYLTGLLQG